MVLADAALDKARAQAQVKSKRAAICRKTENALREAQAELLRSKLAQNKSDETLRIATEGHALAEEELLRV